MGDSNNLNKLLEDALDDLLIDDAPKPSNSKKKTDKKEEEEEEEEKFGQNKMEKSHQEQLVDEKEMDKFFASMTQNLNKIDPGESVPQIMELMQNLLSKELLYPALKDLEPKFEEWLKNNRATLGKEDRVRFKRQLSTIHQIIEVFDDESLEPRQRFERNLELMEKMQTYGAPPEELTVPDGMSKCSIM